MLSFMLLIGHLKNLWQQGDTGCNCKEQYSGGICYISKGKLGFIKECQFDKKLGGYQIFEAFPESFSGKQN